MFDQNNYISVNDINLYIKKCIEENKNLMNINLVGEISNFTNHFKTGHFYFTLKDEKSSIKAVMFKGYNDSISFVPENGLKVTVTGDIKVYAPNGVYQIFCKKMMPFGQGSYKILFEKLYKKLSVLGMFDKKLTIKKNPNVLGIITSLDGAALQDVLSVIERRNPFIKVYIYPAIMQGENCAKSIISCFEKADNDDICDIILITRGGGSTEDLWQFNDENLASVIFNRKKPVISAIGHEIDYTILDYISDLRAATPSVAAETICDNIRESINFENIKLNLLHKLESNLDSKIELIKSIEERLETSIFTYLKDKENSFKNLVKIFDNINIYSILNKGYSIVQKENNIVKSVLDVKKGDTINLRMNDGFIYADVKSIKKGKLINVKK